MQGIPGCSGPISSCTQWHKQAGAQVDLTYAVAALQGRAVRCGRAHCAAAGAVAFGQLATMLWLAGGACVWKGSRLHCGAVVFCQRRRWV